MHPGLVDSDSATSHILKRVIRCLCCSSCDRSRVIHREDLLQTCSTPDKEVGKEGEGP